MGARKAGRYRKVYPAWPMGFYQTVRDRARGTVARQARPAHPIGERFLRHHTGRPGEERKSRKGPGCAGRALNSSPLVAATPAESRVSSRWGLVSQEGIEPSTRGLKVPCSTTELLARLRHDSSSKPWDSTGPEKVYCDRGTPTDATSSSPSRSRWGPYPG